MNLESISAIAAQMFAQTSSSLAPRMVGMGVGIPMAIVAYVAFYQRHAGWMVFFAIFAILSVVVAISANGGFNVGMVGTILGFSFVGGAVGRANGKRSNNTP